MYKRVTVTKESTTGRNTHFHDNFNGNNMTRTQFIKEIKKGSYEDYYVRDINGVPTPCSKPDSSKRNNLE